MQDIIILESVFQEKIWGGTKLKEVYGYAIPSERTGECWAISAHPHGNCKVLNGPLKGKKLSEVYEEHRELFNDCPSPKFPLLTKIIDAKDDLSVQVHPDDEYAKIHANEFGKTECWYILDCDDDAELVYGHHAKSKEEMISMIENQEWDQFLRRVKIKPGDFFYVPAGTVHALCKGTLVLEVQQSSDTTYRLYDYDRIDQHGNKRDLHIMESLDVITVPFEEQLLVPEENHFLNGKKTVYASNKFFTVEKWEIIGEYSEQISQFKLIDVLEGEGEINGLPIKKGNHFIVTTVCSKIELTGNLSLMVSYL